MSNTKTNASSVGIFSFFTTSNMYGFGIFVLSLAASFTPLHPNDTVMGIGFAVTAIATIAALIYTSDYISRREEGGNRGRGYDDINKRPLACGLAFAGVGLALFVPVSIFSMKFAGYISVSFAFLSLLSLLCCVLICLWDVSAYSIKRTSSSYSTVLRYGFHYRGFSLRRVSCGLTVAYAIICVATVFRLWFFSINGMSNV